MKLPAPIRLLIESARRALSRNFGLLAGANLASQLTSLISIPLLTRWCSVGDFGTFQLYATTVTVGGLLACARYDQAVLVAPEDSTARSLAMLGAVVALGAGALAAGIVLLAGRWGGPGWAALSAWSSVAGAAVFLGGATQAVTQWHVRRADFTAISRSRIAQSFCTVGLQVAAAAAGYGSGALIFGEAVGRAAGLLALLGGVPRSAAGEAVGIRWFALARDYARFPLVSTPSAALNAFGFALPVVALEHYFGSRAVGVFSLLERVMGVPTVLLGQPLSQLFSHRFRTALTAPVGERRGPVWETLRSGALLGAVPFAALLVAGGALFELVFGPAWRHAGMLAQLLVLPYFFGYLVWPLMPALVILNRLRTQLAWDLSRALLMLVALALVGQAGLRYESGVATAVSVMAFMYGVYLVLTFRAIRRHEA